MRTRWATARTLPSIPSRLGSINSQTPKCTGSWPETVLPSARSYIWRRLCALRSLSAVGCRSLPEQVVGGGCRTEACTGAPQSPSPSAPTRSACLRPSKYGGLAFRLGGVPELAGAAPGRSWRVPRLTSSRLLRGGARLRLQSRGAIGNLRLEQQPAFEAPLHAGEAELRVQPGIATIDLPLPASWRGSAARRVSELRAALGPLNARVAARDFEAEALVELDPFGEPGAGIELMRAFKRKLDPTGTFATGRFHGRI